LTLRSLRPEGSRKRVIPRGYGFNIVSVPNYFFESMGWAVVCVMTGSLAGNIYRLESGNRTLTFCYPAYLFTAVSTGQMVLWALKKHANYKKEFGKEYPRGRKAMIPFVL